MARAGAIRALLLGLLTLGGTGCFDAPQPPCAFLCGQGGDCPDGYVCAADNFCKRKDVNPAFVCPLTPEAASADAAPGSGDGAPDSAP